MQKRHRQLSLVGTTIFPLPKVLTKTNSHQQERCCATKSSWCHLLNIRPPIQTITIQKKVIAYTVTVNWMMRRITSSTNCPRYTRSWLRLVGAPLSRKSETLAAAGVLPRKSLATITERAICPPTQIWSTCAAQLCSRGNYSSNRIKMISLLKKIKKSSWRSQSFPKSP